MDRLWSPWRFDYIRGLRAPDNGCVFCRILSEDRDEENLVLYRGKHSFALLNLFPYCVGHVLIVLNRHVAFLRDAQPGELAELMVLAQRVEEALESEYQPEGFNVGFNLGKAAGAGVAYHLHQHLLPRWTGDSNFISVVSETRVLPEELPKTYRRLVAHFV